MLGKIYMFWAIPVPSVLAGGLYAFFIPQKLLSLYYQYAFAEIIHIFISVCEDIHLIDKLVTSKLFNTFVYMCCNATILHNIRKYNCEILLWSIKPLKRKNSSDDKAPIPSKYMDKIIPCRENHCGHKYSCDQFLLKELKTYFMIGFGLELGRITIRNFNMLKNKPFKFFSSIPKLIHLNVVGFAFGYAGLYRVLQCMLIRYFEKDSSLGHIIAAFVAGSSYYLYPNKTFAANAIAITLNLSLENFIRSKTQQSTFPSNIAWLNTLPAKKIAYPFMLAFCLFVRLCYPWMTSEFFRRFVSAVSNNKFDKKFTIFYREAFGDF